MTEELRDIQSNNMAASFRRGLLFLPQFQQVRCRSKVNIQFPKPRHDARRLFEAITKPIIPPEPIPHTEVCVRKRAEMLSSSEVNLFEEFLLKQCQKMLAENRMLAVCQALPMSAEQKKAARNKFRKKGMKLVHFNNTIMRRAVADTALVNLNPFLIGTNLYVASEEPLLKDLLAVVRKVPQLILLGARVDSHLLSKEGIMTCAKLPSMDLLRGELVTILGSPASRTRSLVSHHQQVLATNLDQYAKQVQEEKTASPESTDS